MTDAHPTIVPVSWEEVHRDGKRLAAKLAAGPIAEKGPFRGIIGISRGGLVPAAILSRELDLRMVETIAVAAYTGKEVGEAKLIKGVMDEVGDGSGWLIVDDLVDTGVTAELVRDIIPRAHYATIYAKPKGRPFADTFVEAIDQHVWLVFPWDPSPGGD